MRREMGELCERSVQNDIVDVSSILPLDFA